MWRRERTQTSRTLGTSGSPRLDCEWTWRRRATRLWASKPSKKMLQPQPGKSGYRFVKNIPRIFLRKVAKKSRWADGHFTFVVAGFRACILSISKPHHP